MEVIHSSLSFGESSVWDPKVIREHLLVPEDQLKLLNNIPGWSKDKDNSNILSASRDIIINDFQSSQKQNLTTVSLSNRIKENIKLFKKHSQNHKIILQSIKIQRKNFFRSVSLSNINECIENSSYDKSLKRVLSAPSLSETFYTSSSLLHESPKSITSIVFYPSKELFKQKSTQNCLIAKKQTKLNLENMEIISPLPVNICVATKESNANVVEKSKISSIHTTASSVNASNHSQVNNMHADNCLTPVSEKECLLTKPNNLETIENVINSCNVKDTLSIDKSSIDTEKGRNNEGDQNLMKISVRPSETFKASELFQKEMSPMVKGIVSDNEGGDSNLQHVDKEVNKEPHVETRVSSANPASLTSFKEINTRAVNIVGAEKYVNEKDSDREVTECNKKSPEKNSSLVIPSAEKSVEEIESNKNIETSIYRAPAKKADDEIKSNETCSNIVVDSAVVEKCIVASLEEDKIVEKKSLKMTGATEKITTEKTVAEKRKLEYKEKTNKKRKSNAEKRIQSGTRNIKRAGEIYYSESNFRSLMNILKNFS